MTLWIIDHLNMLNKYQAKKHNDPVTLGTETIIHFMNENLVKHLLLKSSHMCESSCFSMFHILFLTVEDTLCDQLTLIFIYF